MRVVHGRLLSRPPRSRRRRSMSTGSGGSTTAPVRAPRRRCRRRGAFAGWRLGRAWRGPCQSGAGGVGSGAREEQRALAEPWTRSCTRCEAMTGDSTEARSKRAPTSHQRSTRKCPYSALTNDQLALNSIPPSPARIAPENAPLPAPPLAVTLPLARMTAAACAGEDRT